jgi:ribonuclease HI
MTCLATRIPYGEKITPEKLNRIEQVEILLRELGYKGFRVRHHDKIARIEVNPSELGRIVNDKDKIIQTAKAAGFNYITLDLEGYRSGSMDEVVDKTAKPKKEPKPFKPKIFGKDIYTIYIDGCSKGNPGEAAFAGVIFNGEGKEVLRVAETIGIATNNVAEYTALICTLNAALNNGFKKVVVLSDSELVVKQINGSYKVKNENLKPLFRQANEVRKKFASFKIDSIPRTQNSLADRIANEAMNKAKEEDKREVIPSLPDNKI